MVGNGRLLRLLLLHSTIFALLFLHHFPTLYAALHVPQGYVFTGNAPWFDPWDLNVYVTAIKWGQQGHFLLENLYTTQSGPSALMYPLYTGIGFIFRNANPYFLFTVLALLMSYVLCIGIYTAGRVFFQNSFWKRIVLLLLVGTGGGFGWALNQRDLIPDAWYTSFTYHSAFQRGHEGLGVLSYLAFLVLLFHMLQGSVGRKHVIPLFSLFGLALLLYPYNFIHASAMMGLLVCFFPAIRRRGNVVLMVLLLVMGAAEILLYYAHLRSSGFGSVVGQQLQSAPILMIGAAYGLFLPLFLYGVFSMFRSEYRVRFCALWIITGIGLSLLPVGIARFFLRGLFFPMSVIAIYALEALANRYHLKRTVLYILLLLIVPMTNIGMFQERMKGVAIRDVWYFMPATVAQGINYFDRYTGNHIPAWTLNRVYMGHSIQTPDAAKKVEQLGNFYRGAMKPADAHVFLQRNHIEYVFHGPVEQSYGGTISRYRFLRQVFKNSQVTIYRAY